MVNILVRIESSSDSGNRCLHPASGLMVSEVSIFCIYILRLISSVVLVRYAFMSYNTTVQLQ